MSADGKISFAELLDIIHVHSAQEKIPEEILRAFIAQDHSRSGQMLVASLKHVLCGWGEPLSDQQFSDLMQEAGIKGKYFKYEDLIKLVSAPKPDYWTEVSWF